MLISVRITLCNKKDLGETLSHHNQTGPIFTDKSVVRWRQPERERELAYIPMRKQGITNRIESTEAKYTHLYDISNTTGKKNSM